LDDAAAGSWSEVMACRITAACRLYMGWHRDTTGACGGRMIFPDSGSFEPCPNAAVSFAGEGENNWSENVGPTSQHPSCQNFVRKGVVTSGQHAQDQLFSPSPTKDPVSFEPVHGSNESGSGKVILPPQAPAVQRSQMCRHTIEGRRHKGRTRKRPAAAEDVGVATDGTGRARSGRQAGSRKVPGRLFPDRRHGQDSGKVVPRQTAPAVFREGCSYTDGNGRIPGQTARAGFREGCSQTDGTGSIPGRLFLHRRQRQDSGKVVPTQTALIGIGWTPDGCSHTAAATRTAPVVTPKPHKGRRRRGRGPGRSR
jgi:hypothetical protein